MRGLIASARTAACQRRHLYQAAGGGALAGLVLWAIFPGMIARTAPESWHWPKRMAARTLWLDKWSAGERLLATAKPERWQTALFSNRIVQENREAITACRSQARKSAARARCTIIISPEIGARRAQN